MSRPPGVAVVVYDVDQLGGMQRQARLLFGRYADRGGRVFVVSPVHVSAAGVLPPNGLELVERHGRFVVVRVPYFTAWRQDSAVALFESAAALVLGAIAPRIDVVYAVQWSSAEHAARLARFLGVPHVLKLAGGGANGDMTAVAEGGAGSGARRAVLDADRIVCVSPEIAAEVAAAGVSEERIWRIPNGVDLVRFDGVSVAALPGPPDAERVLFTGAFRREKRLPELVSAFGRVAAARPRAHLFLAGEGAERPAVEAAVGARGLGGRVHLLGTRDDVPALLAAAHAFVLTSESEGLSNALLEALAAGVPVVASDVAGNRALVEPEREALLVPLGDETALARALERVLADRALARGLAAAGRERVERYSLERVVADYDRAFRSLARHERPSSHELALRYLARFEGAGLSFVAARGLDLGVARGRALVSRAVVAAKRALGIEGPIFR